MFLLTLKGSNIALAFTLRIQGDNTRRFKAVQFRSKSLGVRYNASSSLRRFIKKAEMAVYDVQSQKR